MVEYVVIGNLDPKYFEKEFGPLKTTEVIVTYERIEHLLARHACDVSWFEEYAVSAIEDPDFILEDSEHKNTVLMIKCLENTNMNVAVRLALEEENDEKHSKNSIMTFYRLRNSNLKKYKNSKKTIYKKE